MQKRKFVLVGIFFIIFSISIAGSVAAEFVPPDGGGTRDGQKIGVFLWSSATSTQSIINEYITILSNEGYTKFYCYENPDIPSVFQEIRDYEIYKDTIFFYLDGHGSYNSYYDDSRWYYRPTPSISSATFKDHMDTLQAQRKGFLIDACYSGGFVDDFRGSSYLAISSSSKNHESEAYDPLPSEGMFADVFFYYVKFGYSAYGAFVKADLQNPGVLYYDGKLWWWPYQDPQYSNGLSYNFFA